MGYNNNNCCALLMILFSILLLLPSHDCASLIASFFGKKKEDCGCPYLAPQGKLWEDGKDPLDAVLRGVDIDDALKAEGDRLNSLVSAFYTVQETGLRTEVNRYNSLFFNCVYRNAKIAIKPPVAGIPETSRIFTIAPQMNLYFVPRDVHLNFLEAVPLPFRSVLKYCREHILGDQQDNESAEKGPLKRSIYLALRLCHVTVSWRKQSTIRVISVHRGRGYIRVKKGDFWAPFDRAIIDPKSNYGDATRVTKHRFYYESLLQVLRAEGEAYYDEFVNSALALIRRLSKHVTGDKNNDIGSFYDIYYGEIALMNEMAEPYIDDCAVYNNFDYNMILITDARIMEKVVAALKAKKRSGYSLPAVLSYTADILDVDGKVVR